MKHSRVRKKNPKKHKLTIMTANITVVKKFQLNGFELNFELIHSVNVEYLLRQGLHVTF